MRRLIQAWLTIAASLLSGVVAGQTEETGVVRFCAGTDNLPMSDTSWPYGFEVQIAEQVAAKMGREARFEWLAPHTESFEEAVLQGRCDAALGTIVDPGPMAGNRTLPGVRVTAPYYEAGYVVIRRADAPPVRHLSEIGDERIGLEAESIATYSLRQRGHKVHVMRNAKMVVGAVAEGRVRYGYLWGPTAAWMLRDRQDVVVAREFAPAERWSFAFTVRERDSSLKAALDAAVEELRESGTVSKILRTYESG